MIRLVLAALMLLAPGVAVAQSTARNLSNTLRSVADRARPAVVHVHVKKGQVLAPELREVLQEHELELGGAMAMASEATGSGVIVSREGRVWTNHHVIEGATSITLVLSDQRRLAARLVGSDPRTDVALLQIESDGPFPWLPVGDSDTVSVGDLVMAVGNPFDFQSTVTMGIVSATGRRGLSSREIQDYIQTDAAVNPGNSGGPLLDAAGRIVAINTAIFSPGVEQNSGISFAIPSNMARRIAGDLENLGRVRRSRVGLLTHTVTEVDGDRTRHGAEVEWVVPDSPAESAGMRRGDIVVAVDGEPIVSTRSLRNLVLAREVGATLEFSVARDEVIEHVKVETVDARAVGTGYPDLPEVVLGWGGMVLADPGRELRGHFDLPGDRGVVVAYVEPDSAGAMAGMTAGDLLLTASGEPIDDLASLETRLEEAPPGAVVVGFRRGGGNLYAVLPAH